MAKSTIESQIQARVEEFAAELSTLVRQAALEAVEDAIRGGGAAVTGRAARRAAGRPAKAAKSPARRSVSRTASGRRRRRSPEELEAMQGDLVAYITKKPGERLEQIAVGMEIDSQDLKRPIQLLLDAKALTKEGQRRGTRYFAKGAAKSKGSSKPKAAKKTRKKAARK